MVILPEPFSRIPRAQLMYPGPTPILKLERIASAYAPPESKSSVWVKHEDTNSPLAGGGNKIRKLEYLVPEITASGCDTIVTTGGIQSNHCRQVAALGTKLGLKVVTVHDDRGVSTDEVYYKLGNQQLSKLMGSTVYIDENIENVLNRIKAEGGKPYLVPSGATNHPLGGLGFARWAFELSQQEIEMGVFSDTIVVAANGGSTVAGMVAGFKLMENLNTESGRRRIVCVDAASKPVTEFSGIILKLARNAAEKIGLNPEEIGEIDFTIENRFSDGKYGHPQPSTVDAVHAAASLEGLILDPVYTGKAFTAVIGLLRSGELPEGSNMLFCHTGGQAVLGAYGPF